MSKIPVFINRKAGVFSRSPEAGELEALAKQLGIAVEVIATKDMKQMQQLIRQRMRHGAKRIAVAGGDGTVAAAAQVLAHTNVALGIIPMGTANNFATALRLPMDLTSALRVLRDGVPQAVSLGKIGDYYFTEAAGVGLFANILAFYSGGERKNPFKTLWAVVKNFIWLRGHRLEIIADGQRIKQRAVMCTVANTFRMSLAMPIAPDAKLTSDDLDVVIVGELRRRDLWPLYRAIRSQLHLSLPHVSHVKAKRIEIRSSRSLPVHCDDRICAKTPVTLTVQPRALRVLVDRL